MEALEMASLSHAGEGSRYRETESSHSVEGVSETQGLLTVDREQRASSLPERAVRKAAMGFGLGNACPQFSCSGRLAWLWALMIASTVIIIGTLELSLLPWRYLDGEGGAHESSAFVPAPRHSWKWKAFHAVLKAKAERSGGEVAVLLLGDSITEELLGTSLGKSSHVGGRPEEKISVWKEYYEPLHSLNLGVSGDRTQNLLWRLQNGELPDVLKPQSVMVAVGTNNLGSGQSSQDTVLGIKAVVNYMLEARPDALICVMALFPRTNIHDKDNTPWSAVAEVNEDIQNAVKSVWKENNVRFVDCTDRFLTTNADGKTILNPEGITHDQLHLTVVGLKMWAECAATDIKAGLGDR